MFIVQIIRDHVSQQPCGVRRPCDASGLAIIIRNDSLPMSFEGDDKSFALISLVETLVRLSFKLILSSNPLDCTVYDSQLREPLPQFLPYQHHMSTIPLPVYTPCAFQRPALVDVSRSSCLVLFSYVYVGIKTQPGYGGLCVSCHVFWKGEP